MPIPGTSDVIEMTLGWLMNGQQLRNVFHYVTPANAMPNTLAGARDAADVVFNNLTADADFLASFHTSCFLDFVSVQKIKPTRWARGRSFNAAGEPGTRGGTAMPTSTQASIMSLTDESGASGHGGTRVAGMAIADLLLSEFTGAYLTALTLGWGQFYEAFDFGAFFADPIVYRRASYLDSSLIVGFEPQRQARTMRRRVVGRGI